MNVLNDRDNCVCFHLIQKRTKKEEEEENSYVRSPVYFSD